MKKMKTNYLRLFLLILSGALSLFFVVGFLLGFIPTILSFVSEIQHYGLELVPFLLSLGIFLMLASPVLFFIVTFLFVKAWKKNKTLMRVMIGSIPAYLLGMLCVYIALCFSGPF